MPGPKALRGRQTLKPRPGNGSHWSPAGHSAAVWQSCTPSPVHIGSHAPPGPVLVTPTQHTSPVAQFDALVQESGMPVQVPVVTHVSWSPAEPPTQHSCAGSQTSPPQMTGGGGGGAASRITPLELLPLKPLLLVPTPLLVLLVASPLLVLLVPSPPLVLLATTPLLVPFTPLLALTPLLVLTPPLVLVVSPLLTPLLPMTPLLDAPPSSVCSRLRSPSRTVRPPQAATTTSAVGRKARLSLMVLPRFGGPLA